MANSPETEKQIVDFAQEGGGARAKNVKLGLAPRVGRRQRQHFPDSQQQHRRPPQGLSGVRRPRRPVVASHNARRAGACPTAGQAAMAGAGVREILPGVASARSKRMVRGTRAKSLEPRHRLETRRQPRVIAHRRMTSKISSRGQLPKSRSLDNRSYPIYRDNCEQISRTWANFQSASHFRCLRSGRASRTGGDPLVMRAIAP
jgi:hypothetical protein